MVDQYHHGISLVEVSDGARSLAIVATAVIGLVVTGPAADAAAFPLDRPVLITDIATAIGKAGVTGTMKRALTAIADQVKTPIVLVRVAPGADEAETSAAVIGTTTDGIKSGLQALLAAEAQVGIRPRILGCPGLDTEEVTAALIVVAQKLRAMAYASAIGTDVATAIAYRGGFAARELMLLHPDFVSFDVDAAANVTSFAVARALGLRARIDQEQGFAKTLSNVTVQGVTGLTRDIQFDIQDAGTEAGLLNAADITALIRSGGGFRFWGSRTCSEDPLFAFESATRTAQVLADTIANGLMWAIDKPLRPSLVKDIVETINAEFRILRSAGAILGGHAWFDADRNPATALQGGKVVIDYDYTPVPPLEQLGLTQRITDTYLADFAALVAQA
ncbi:phage tail sheath subtilisin-like domain-containing protein [Sphingomonas oligophenolica]|uniref:Phage tail protein n=1 Tax=Sphingomonas oligophenolica TaxID=301154 RepID=A0A502CNZ6_9SPHN|nr:phage tail sheath subtilisin-like domain-containing protein [Sphingomonas oligophenolica]TPG14374.1 phage tail protein [Sphingomonas oligophenolica]